MRHLARNTAALWLAAIALAGTVDSAAAYKMQSLPTDVLQAMNNKDYAKARQLLEPIAAAGGDLAQSLLGRLYEGGGGGERDYVKAIEWYRKAAEQGDLRSQLNLGDMYRAGVGTPSDMAEARRWYQQAAEQGEEGAEETFARFLHDTQDEAAAFPYLKKLAAAGNATGGNRLNAFVMPPLTEWRPAFCYVESKAARAMMPYMPRDYGGMALFLHAATGCGLRVAWFIGNGEGKADEGERSLGDGSIADIRKAGFETLPEKLDLAFEGCGKNASPSATLVQSGPELQVRGAGGKNAALQFGAIIKNHIVLLIGVTAEIEDYFRLIALYPSFVFGDWQGDRAELVSPSGDCKVTVTAQVG